MSTTSHTNGCFPTLQPLLEGRPCWGVEGDGPSRVASAHCHLLKRAGRFFSSDNENNREMALNSESFFCGCVLSSIQTTTRPARGSINYCLIVNNAYVIRFDITGKTVSRFQSKALAYQNLCDSGLPVPEVVAFDRSKELVPYEYLITTRLEGTPVIDSWSGLSAQERERVACEAGRYLAVIHSHTFDRFGYKLYTYLEFLVDSKRRAVEDEFQQVYTRLQAALQ